jgi:N-acetylglucosamine-6-phosphate deacetylase
MILAGADMIVDGKRQSGLAVQVHHGRILLVGPDEPRASERYALPADALLAPGFVDIQVNGGGSVLFNDTPTRAAGLAMAAAHRRLGTTAILPTLITDRPEVMRRAGEAACDAIDVANGGVIGVHFEGPFLSPKRPGVHRADLIREMAPDDVAFLENLAARVPVLLTLAPECVDDDDLARLATGGVVLAAGHSAAPFERMVTAMEHGLRGVTHVFNAMPPATARDPGLMAAALGMDDLFCGVIADLIHVHPAMLGVLLRCKRPDKIMLVSDAMSVAGTDEAGFVLQGRDILRRDGKLVTADGTLAGADLSLAQAVRTMAALPGVSVAQAIGMASWIPAAFMRLGLQIGSIAPARRADFVVLDPDLNVLGTWVGGDYQKAPGA